MLSAVELPTSLPIAAWRELRPPTDQRAAGSRACQPSATVTLVVALTVSQIASTRWPSAEVSNVCTAGPTLNADGGVVVSQGRIKRTGGPKTGPGETATDMMSPCGLA